MKKITIHNLETSTAQEVFDFIASHLLKQNAKSVKGDNNYCVYRIVKNNKVLTCAAGCLIPKKDYKEQYENISWTIMVEQFKISPAHGGLIERLQEVHDQYRPEEWHLQLEDISNGYKLKFNHE